MTLTIILLSLLNILFIFVIFNMMKKNEKCEDVIISYEQYMIKLSEIIEISDKKLQEIENKGTFDSDDEIGFFFQQLKHLQEQLNNFKVK